MSRTYIFVTGLIATTFVSYLIVSQTSLKYSAIILTLVQAAICYPLAIQVERICSGFATGLTISFASGWATSFIASLVLEVIFFKQFLLAIQEQISYGNLLENMTAWAAFSIVYAGPVQSVGTFILLRTLRPYRK